MTAEELEAIHQVVRRELRLCGIRPPAPPGLAWRWEAEQDEWVTVLDQKPAATMP